MLGHLRERLQQVAERTGRLVRVGQVPSDVGMMFIELRRALMNIVSSLGDGQRNDPALRRGHLFEHGLRIVGGEKKLDDRADHPRPVAGRVAFDDRVETVLGAQGIADVGVVFEQPDPAIPPVAIAGQQIVTVEGPGACPARAVPRPARPGLSKGAAASSKEIMLSAASLPLGDGVMLTTGTSARAHACLSVSELQTAAESVAHPDGNDLCALTAFRALC